MTWTSRTYRWSRAASPPTCLAGQVALVTGGATGIGKEICRVLGRHGAPGRHRQPQAGEPRSRRRRAPGRGHRRLVRRLRRARRRGRAGRRRRGRRPSGAARHRGQQRGRQLPRADDEDLAQRVQGRRRHRPARHLQRLRGGVRRLAAGARRQHREHQRPVRAAGRVLPGPCGRGQVRGRLAHPHLCGRVGPLRHPGQRHRPRARSPAPRACSRFAEAVPGGATGRPTNPLGLARATAPTSPTWRSSCAARSPGSSRAR